MMLSPATHGILSSLNLVLDEDVQVFKTATGIHNYLVLLSLNTLVLGLKAAGLWVKIKALYPLVGGTAFTHKFNVKDARDDDSAYRLTFYGGWTHDSSGALPSYANGYANSHLKQSEALSVNSASCGVNYNESNTSTAGGFEGDGTGPSAFGFFAGYGGGDIFYGYVSSGSDTQSVPNLIDGKGFRAVSRVDSSEIIFALKNLTNTQSSHASAASTKDFYFGAMNIGDNPGLYSSVKRNTMFLADGLTETELVVLSDLITAFNTQLGR